MPDFTQASASSAVFSRFLYSISHDIDILNYSPLDGPQHAGVTRRSSHLFFIPHSGIINRPVEKHFQHLQQFEFTHDLDRAVHDRFAFQKFPKVLLGENDGLDNFTERHALPCASRPDFPVAVLDIEFVLPQQPLAQVAVDFVNTLSQFMGGNIAEMRDLGTGLNSLFQPPGKCIGVSFDQTNESVGKHHHTPLVVPFFEHEARLHTPSLSAASWLLQPSTGILMLSTLGSSVCGTVMAREIMHTDFVRRKSASPASI